jgi:hypothetical protein
MKNLLLTIILVFLAITTFGRNTNPENSQDPIPANKENNRRHFAGSTLFILGNLTPGKPVYFFQLNYGYKVSKNEYLIAEAITWTYYEPLGTYGSSDEFYPGKVRAFGLGLGYQRFLWKNLYVTAEPTFFVQQFYDTNDNKIQKGFQLYMQFIAGYRFEFMKNHLFIEPALALKYWPVNTNFPDSFAEIEKGKPKYKFEPSLNFGIRF